MCNFVSQNKKLFDELDSLIAALPEADESALIYVLKEAQGIFIKRLIYGIAVFFVVLAVQAVFSLLGERTTANSNCFKCAAHASGCERSAAYGENNNFG